MLFLSILFLLLIFFVGFLWIRERRYLKKKTSEAMSDAAWKEIVVEREVNLEKRRRFREALERAQSKG